MSAEVTADQVQALVTRAPYHQWLGLKVVALYDDNLRALMDLIAACKMRPVIDKVLPLEQAREGLRLIQDREVIGKVVVVP